VLPTNPRPPLDVRSGADPELLRDLQRELCMSVILTPMISA